MKAQSSYIANGYASGAAFSEMAIAVRTNASKQGQSRSLTPTGSPHASGGFARTAGIALIFVLVLGPGGQLALSILRPARSSQVSFMGLIVTPLNHLSG